MFLVQDGGNGLSTPKFIIFFSIMVGSLVRTVPTILFFAGASEVTSAWLKVSLLIMGGISFANTGRLAVKTWQTMNQIVD